MKRLLAGVLILSSLQIANAASTDTLKAVREKVVELHIVRAEMRSLETKKKQRARIETLQGQSICSGAVISSSGDILTARHCTEDATGIEVVFADGREYRAVILATSARHDLSLIHVDRFNTPFFSIAESVLQGQSIWVIGNPLGITASLCEGIVAKQNGDVDFIDVTVLPGNSGGPAFNELGELVGITTAGIVVLNGFSHLNIMQSIDAILGFSCEWRGLR